MVNALNDMAQLAIKGHSTRGNEVIKILEMLGGNNLFHYRGDLVDRCYYIGNDEYVGKVIALIKIPIDSIVFTLEEFLEKFPYKIGDKVSSKYLKNYEVSKMEWESVNNRVIYKLQGMGWYSADELQPYKEETMDKANKIVFDANAQCCDISNKIIKKETMEKEISGAIIDRFICLEGYDFYDDKGNIIDTKHIIMKKKQPKYPKTYEECCKVLGCKADNFFTEFDCSGCDVEISDYEDKIDDLLQNFRKLIYYRDAYWKIAGDWKPNLDSKQHKFAISNVGNEISFEVYGEYNSILCFPTEEMRDAFYENFKDLIEKCKELL